MGRTRQRDLGDAICRQEELQCIDGRLLFVQLHGGCRVELAPHVDNPRLAARCRVNDWDTP